MPNVDPKIAFYIGLILIVAQVIDSAGPSLLQNAVPAVAIGIIVAWCGIITKVGIAVMTYITGTNMTQSGRIASVQTLSVATRAADLANDSAVRAVVLNDQAAADAIPSDKVIGVADLKKAS